MDMTYKDKMNAFALSCMPQTVSIPDFRLCIGDAECLKSVPVMLFTEQNAPSQKPKFEDVNKIPIEKIGLTGDGNYVSEDNFESDNFFNALHTMGVT